MAIYGTALLAFCVLAGLGLGKLLAALCHLDPQVNVGGVGFAMLLLIFITNWLRRRGSLPAATEGGILFWSAIYIPVIVAMAASQNVFKALHGGWIAVLAGAASVILCGALIPVISRMGQGDEPPET